MHRFALVLAAPDGGSSGINFNGEGLIEFVLKVIVPIILTAIGVMLLAGARNNQMRKTAETVTQIVIGLIVIVGAGGFILFAEDLAHLAFPGSA